MDASHTPAVLRGRAGKLLSSAALAVLLALAVSQWQAVGGLPRGTPAPPLAAELTDGTALRLGPGAAAGDPRVTVISFWASWCGACRRETPALNALHAALRERRAGRVVGLNVEGTPLRELAPLARRVGAAFPVGTADDALLDAWAVERLPTTYVVARDGRIQATFVGPVGVERLEAAVARAGR